MNREVIILIQMRDRASAGFAKVSRSVSGAMNRIESSVAGAGKALKNYATGAEESRETSEKLAGTLRAVAIGAGILSAAFIMLAKTTVGTAMEMESLMMGLSAVSGGAKEATTQLKELREIAKLPGLGLKEAIQGATRLQAVELQAKLANRALMAFGNALARVGKGRYELEGVILAFTQMVGKGKVMAEEINQIAERVPEVRKVMMQAFGTADTKLIQKMSLTVAQFIEILVEGFEKLPKVISGSRNEVENFSDVLYDVRVAVGNVLLPSVTKVLGILASLASEFNKLSDTQKSLITWAGVVVGGIATIVAGGAGLLLILPQLTVAVTVLGSALMFLAANPIGMVITAIGALVAAFFIFRKIHKDSIITAEKFSDAIDKMNDRMRETRGIGALAEELGNLRSETDRTKEESARLYEVQEKLAEISPELIRGYDDQGRVLSKSKKEIMGFAAEQYKLLDVEREILVLRAKQRASELSKQLGKETQELTKMSKKLDEIKEGGRVWIRGEMGRQRVKKNVLLEILAEQAERVRDLRGEYKSLMAEIERAEQRRGMRVDLPLLPEVTPETKLKAKELEKIEKDLLKARQETRDILAEVTGDELKILEARHLKEMEDIDERIKALSKGTEAEVQLVQVLNQQKLALDAKYLKERSDLEKSFIDKRNENLERNVAFVVQKSFEELAAFRATVQDRLAVMEWERDERKQLAQQTLKQEQYELDLGVKIALKGQKLKAKYEREFTKSVEKEAQRRREIEEVTTEWFQGNLDERIEASKKAYERLSKQTKGFEKTVRDVMTGWKKLTVDTGIMEIEEPTISIKNVLKSISVELGGINDQYESLISNALETKKVLEETKKTGSLEDIARAARDVDLALQDLAYDIEREFVDIGVAIGAALSDVFFQWVDDGKEAMSELELASHGFVQAITGDYWGLVKTVGGYFSQVWDIWRGIDTDVKEAVKQWSKELPQTIADTIGRGVLEGLSAADIGKQVEEYLYQQVIMRAINVLLLGWGDFNAAVKTWATKLEEALGEYSPVGETIGIAEAEAIKKATEDIKSIARRAGVYGAELAEDLFGEMGEGIEDSIREWEEKVSSSITDVLTRGVKDGLSAVEVGDSVRKFLKEQIFDQAIKTMIKNIPVVQNLIEKWADLMANAFSKTSEGGAKITEWELKFIESAGRELGWVMEDIADESIKLADTLGLSFEQAGKDVRKGVVDVVSAGEEFAKALQPGLESSWTNLWRSMFDPDAVVDPLMDFADTLDEMIFKQLVAVFTKSPEIIRLAKELGEYIASAFQDGIVTELEKQRIDEYRKQLVLIYGENTNKLMTAVDMLDLRIRQSRDAQQKAVDWMEFTKVGIFPDERGFDRDIALRDILMKPQQAYLEKLEAGYPYVADESLAPTTQGMIMEGKTQNVSDVIETKPGITFIQNNQFSGLVNFDNPEAMRELARKLQPYSEELNERWVA